MSTELNLDIATMEGKTWLAEITGTDAKFGLQRSFVNAVEKTTSRSGKTGTASYLVGDGVYESNEGRRRLGRRYWIVRDGQVREVNRAEALAELERLS
jgi:hypothetical protein